MGFLSIVEDKEIYSFMLNDEQWHRLKKIQKLVYPATFTHPNSITYIKTHLI